MTGFYSGRCYHCDRPSPHLVKTLLQEVEGLDDDGRPEVVEFQALVCQRCSLGDQVLDDTNWSDFNLRLLKGKLAQILIETVFLEFDWGVFPFGYESYFTSVIKELARKGGGPALKLRSMPDLVVTSPDDGRPHILEVKATTARGTYLLSEQIARRYAANWPEAELVVFSRPERAAFAATIEALVIPDRPRTHFQDGKPAVALELGEDLIRLEEFFNFPRLEFDRILNKSLHQMAAWG